MSRKADVQGLKRGRPAGRVTAIPGTAVFGREGPCRDRQARLGFRPRVVKPRVLSKGRQKPVFGRETGHLEMLRPWQHLLPFCVDSNPRELTSSEQKPFRPQVPVPVPTGVSYPAPPTLAVLLGPVPATFPAAVPQRRRRATGQWSVYTATSDRGPNPGEPVNLTGRGPRPYLVRPPPGRAAWNAVVVLQPTARWPPSPRRPSRRPGVSPEAASEDRALARPFLVGDMRWISTPRSRRAADTRRQSAWGSAPAPRRTFGVRGAGAGRGRGGPPDSAAPQGPFAGRSARPAVHPGVLSSPEGPETRHRLLRSLPAFNGAPTQLRTGGSVVAQHVCPGAGQGTAVGGGGWGVGGGRRARGARHPRSRGEGALGVRAGGGAGVLLSAWFSKRGGGGGVCKTGKAEDAVETDKLCLHCYYLLTRLACFLIFKREEMKCK